MRPGSHQVLSQFSGVFNRYLTRAYETKHVITDTQRRLLDDNAGNNGGDMSVLGDATTQEVAFRPMATQPMSVAPSVQRSTVSPAAEEVAWAPPTWDEVVRQHADRVYRLAYRLTGNQHDAEDLTQETFIRVFRSLASYKPGTFEGWLHRITTNLFLDMARRRSRLRMEGLPEDSDRLPGGGPSPEQVFNDTHLDPDLQTALDELPPEFRAAVVLCDVEGLSYEEIGATLGVKLGTVRSRIHRGRQMLKATLEARREHPREV
ncbi:RNA polymerase sigma-29 (SigE) subunit [Saccharopolyspora spinosa]|uniref:RNA polymerase sigma-29 (SigE) subunit n=2 Tax=Saccharopolyspora spinosa TaxID=60894 RepID=A0A2N3XUZ8_SACSN|nr:RNA polymerase sigma-29 (SigE) subunit [Saccharopolyspora spinosa]